MKYSILKLLAVTGLTFSLIACNRESEPENITVDFWNTLTQSDRQATINLIINTYEAMHPGVTINSIPVDENDMPTQINASAAAGTLPPLAEGATDLAVAFGSEGFLNSEAATQVINDIGKDRFYKGVLQMNQSTTPDLYYSVPLYGWVQGIWYRADWFEEANLNPPSTWEDILAAAQYFYQPENNQYGGLVGTKDDTFAEQVFTQIAVSNNAKLFDKDGNLVFNSPEMKEALEFYVQLAQYNPPGSQTWRARDYYFQNKLPMFFYSTFIMDDLALAEVAAGSLTNENFEDLGGSAFDPDLVQHTRLASQITHTRPAGYGAILSLFFPNNDDANTTAVAQDFAKYLYEPEPYVTWLHMAPGGMNPVISGIVDTPEFLNDPKGIFKNYGADKMVEIVSGMDSLETFGIVEGNRIEAAGTIYSKQIIPQMIYRITQEGMDIDEAMSWAEGEMRKLL